MKFHPSLEQGQAGRGFEPRSSRWVALLVVTSIWSTGVLAACNGGQPVEQEPEAKIAANAAVAANGRSRQSRIVLPLDHGPRAVTTPALNKKRLEEARKEQLCDTSNS